MKFKIAPLSRAEFDAMIPAREALANELARAQANHKEAQDRQTKGWNYRMENYYNCVDDYSWGGACDRAAAEETSRASYRVSLAKEQLESPTGTFRKTCKVSVLAYLDGTPIENARVVNTQYGRSWVIPAMDGGRPTWVSAETTAATYAKKGFTLLEREYEYEAFVIGDWKYVTLVGSTLAPATPLPGTRKFYPNTHLVSEVYSLLEGEAIVA